MSDIYQLTSLHQREIELMFVAMASQYPLYTVQQCGWLRPEILKDEKVRKFWTALRDNLNPNFTDEQADEVAVTAAVSSGFHTEILNWLDDILPGTTPEILAREIARRSYLTTVSGSLGGLVSAVQNFDDVKAREIINGLSELMVDSGSTMRTAEDAAALFEQTVAAGNRTVPTGLHDLDEAIGGMERQTEIVIAARPSMGKSALAWQIARTVAAQGKTAAFFSLEMSMVSLWARAACPAAGLTWRDVLAGKVTPAQLALLNQHSQGLAKLYQDKLYIEDSTSQTTETIWQTVASVKPELVVVDHLRLLKDRLDMKEHQRLGYCSQRLREIAKSFNLPIVVVAQLNREVERRQDKRPTLADLRESGEIEENADVVLMIYSDSYYTPPLMTTSVFPTEIWVRKFREGARNILVNLDFDARQEWFVPRNVGQFTP